MPKQLNTQISTHSTLQPDKLTLVITPMLLLAFLVMV